MHLNKALPPLDHLLAFEATAMCESFVGAAKLLNISETAISRKVKLLESHYGTPLFFRAHRSIGLTTQGRKFFDDIRPALDHLRSVSLNTMSNQSTRSVTISATNSVSSLWLMPRLQKFRTSHDNAKTMLISSDDDQKCLAETNDLIILRGEGNWPYFTSKLLFSEVIFPVCSPEYLKNHPDAQNIQQLTNMDLIDVSNAHSEWMSWQKWLSHFGEQDSDREQTNLFNTYPLAIQAAVFGLGITLGWAHLVDPLLEAGKLVRPLRDHQVSTQSGYYLLKHDSHPEFPEKAVLENWLLHKQHL